MLKLRNIGSVSRLSHQLRFIAFNQHANFSAEESTENPPAETKPAQPNQPTEGAKPRPYVKRKINQSYQNPRMTDRILYDANPLNVYSKLMNVNPDVFERVYELRVASAYLKNKKNGLFAIKSLMDRRSGALAQGKQADQFFKNEMRRTIGQTVRLIFDKSPRNAANNSKSALLERLNTVIRQAFAIGIYTPFFERDFKSLIHEKEAIPYLRTVFVPEFLGENQSLIKYEDFIDIMDRAANDKAYLPLLEFSRFVKILQDRSLLIQPANMAKGANNLFKLYKKTNEFNYLSVLWTVFHASKGRVMDDFDMTIFADKLINIQWGKQLSKKSKEIFNNHLLDLLHIKFNLLDNHPLQVYLADVFMTSSSYEQGLSQLGYHFCILARLAQGDHHNSDLLHLYQKTFGEENYEFYLKSRLPKILNSMNKKNYALLYQKSLNLFESEKNGSKEGFNLQIKTFFDQNLGVKSNFIFYNHVNNTALDYATPFGPYGVVPAAKNKHPIEQEKEAIKDCLLNGQVNDLMNIMKNDINKTAYGKKLLEESIQENIAHKDFYDLASPSAYSKILKTFYNKYSYVESMISYRNFLIDPHGIYHGDPPPIKRKTHYSSFRADGYEGQGKHYTPPLKKKYEEINIDEEIGVEATNEIIPPTHVQEGDNVAKPTSGKRLDQTPKRAFSLTTNTKSKSLFSTPRRAFSANSRSDTEIITEAKSENEGGENISTTQQQKTGFKGFLKKLKEVDQATSQEEQQKTMISKEEINKMKKILFEGDEEQTKKDEKRIQENKIRPEKGNLEEGKGVISGSSSGISGGGDREDRRKQKIFKKKEVEVIEEKEQPQTFYFAPEYWNAIIKEKTDHKDIIIMLEDHFFSMRNDPKKAQQALHDFIKNQPYRAQGLIEEKKIIYQMINQAYLSKKITNEDRIRLDIKATHNDLHLEPSPELVLKFDTSYGPISKDYNEYLKETIFPYSLGDVAYGSLFNILKDNYKRKFFKRCISHLARYNNHITDKNLSLILDICQQEKIGLTLIEIANLFINGGIVKNDKQFISMIDTLKNFKDLSDNVEFLVKTYVTKTGTTFHLDLIAPYLDMLMKNQKSEKYLYLFDKMKEFLTSRKLQVEENISSEEALKLQEEFKAKNREIMMNYYRDFIKKLNYYDIHQIAKILYKEQVDLRYVSDINDYINGLYANRGDLEETRGILKRLADDPINKYNEECSKTLLNVIYRSPEVLGPLLEDYLRNDILSDNYELTPNSINMIFIIISKGKLYHLFNEFLNYLIRTCPKLKKNTKVLIYRLSQTVEDDLVKGQIQSLADKLFSFEIEQRRESDYYAKRRQKLLELRSNLKIRENEGNRDLQADFAEKKGPKLKKDVEIEEEIEDVTSSISGTNKEEKEPEKTKAQKKAEKKAAKVEKAKAKAEKNKSAEDSKKGPQKKIEEEENEEELRSKALLDKFGKKQRVFKNIKRVMRIRNLSTEKFYLEYETVTNPDAKTDLS